MKTYDVTVTREGRWWMVAVPEIDGLTQARRLSEVGQMARELIALEQDLALSEVEINITEVDVAGLDIHATGELVAQLREDVRQLEDTISRLTSATAQALVEEGVPMRDVAEVIGVSHQRVAQIVGAESAVPAVTIAKAIGLSAAIDAAFGPIRAQHDLLAAALAPIRAQQRAADVAIEAAMRPIRAQQEAIAKMIAPVAAQIREANEAVLIAGITAKATPKPKA